MAQRLDTLVERNLPEVRAAIAAGLEDVIAHAREVAGDGGQILDAADAIAADRVKDFKAIQTIENVYAGLRRLHQVAMLGDPLVTGLTGDPMQLGYFLRNPGSVFGPTGMRHIRAARGEVKALVGAGLDLPDSWTAGNAVWWFARHSEAQPWVPSHAEAQEMLTATQRELADDEHAAARTTPAEVLR